MSGDDGINLDKYLNIKKFRAKPPRATKATPQQKSGAERHFRMMIKDALEFDFGRELTQREILEKEVKKQKKALNFFILDMVPESVIDAYIDRSSQLARILV